MTSQEIMALVIVGATAGLFIWARIRRTRRSTGGCGSC